MTAVKGVPVLNSEYRYSRQGYRYGQPVSVQALETGIHQHVFAKHQYRYAQGCTGTLWRVPVLRSCIGTDSRSWNPLTCIGQASVSVRTRAYRYAMARTCTQVAYRYRP
ncbi:hypothetical protein V6N12_062169 [Hibiscus sabdariffa]|uniref:Uncharacterized protein n=1 Tax=Hibiscus sabdariffa TaxID=183260 RepID=A0ABR2F876_9ROSI